MNNEITDLARVLLVIVPHSLMFFATLAVFWSYWRIYRADRQIKKIDPNPIYGLLPKHVTGISVSTLFMSAGITFDTVGRLDTPFTWRVLTYSISGIMGCWSLWQVLRFERLRYTHIHG